MKYAYIEDNDANVMLLRAKMASVIEVVHFRSIAEFNLSDQEFKTIFLDLMLDYTSGLQSIKNIKTKGDNPLVILLSGVNQAYWENDKLGDYRKAYGSNNVTFLPKTFLGGS